MVDNNVLHKFDEVLFYKSLNDADKKAFNNKLHNYMEIIDFYKSKKEEAKKISSFEVVTSKKVQGQYDKQKNLDGTKNKNQLEIQTTFKNPNTNRALIPASSIKGMLETALKIYVKPPKPSNEIRQNLIISDAIFLDGGVEIGYANRKHRNPNKKSKEGIYQIIEVIKPDSTFLLTIDSKQSFKDIQQSQKSYHAKRESSRYTQSPNSFVAKIGKNVGMDYVVDIDNIQRLKNKDGKPLATHFLYDSDTLKDEEFGWIQFELISDEEYEKELEYISKEEDKYYAFVKEKQKEILEKIYATKKEAEIKKQQQELQEQKEEQERLEAIKKREEALANMTPAEKILDSYTDIPSVVNAMKSGDIEDYDSIKIELASKIKKELSKDPKTWEKAKKKALDRKNFILEILAEK